MLSLFSSIGTLSCWRSPCGGAVLLGLSWAGVWGCGGGSDPILERAAALDDGAATQDDAPPPGGRPEPQPVEAPDPEPVTAAAPAPGAPQDPPPGEPADPPPAPASGGAPGAQPADGPRVTVSGTVSVDGWSGGPIRLDIFDGDQRAAAGGGGPKPSIVAVHQVDKPGPFSLEIPQDAGEVWVGGFADEDRDGRPSPTDPSGWYAGNPVSTAANQSGVTLVLEAAPPPPPGSEE